MTLRIEGSTHTAADKKEIAEAIRALDGVKYVRADMEREKGIYDYDVEAEEKMDIRRALNDLCREKGWNILMLQLSDLTLEDIFLRITMGDNAAAAVDTSVGNYAPKLDLKVENGQLVATEATEQASEASEILEESAADMDKADEDENGGEE